MLLFISHLALEGLAAVVIPVTNLYPLVTIVIALLVFKEKMHWLNGIGILVVVPAIIMLSGQSQIFDDPSLFFKNIGLKVWLLFALGSPGFLGPVQCCTESDNQPYFSRMVVFNLYFIFNFDIAWFSCIRIN